MSRQTDSSSRIIPPHGGYQKLHSFQVAETIYDATVIFCDRFIDRRSRTHDQMVQAARSGVQNIAEGSMASATSKKTEMKLTSVARASQVELLQDYKDFLRQRGLSLWDAEDPRVQPIRDSRRTVFNSGPDPYGIRTAAPEEAANILITLIHRGTFLLRRQLEELEKRFKMEGGFTENLYRQRTAYRKNQKS